MKVCIIGNGLAALSLANVLIKKDIYWKKGIWIKYHIYPWIQAF